MIKFHLCYSTSLCVVVLLMDVKMIHTELHVQTWNYRPVFVSFTCVVRNACWPSKHVILSIINAVDNGQRLCNALTSRPVTISASRRCLSSSNIHIVDTAHSLAVMESCVQKYGNMNEYKIWRISLVFVHIHNTYDHVIFHNSSMSLKGNTEVWIYIKCFQ